MNKVMQRSFSTTTEKIDFTSYRVKVLNAKNLIAADSNGKSDPYVVVSLKTPSNKVQYKTKVIYKTLNPEWDEIFEFHVKEEDIGKSEIVITVWDKDVVGKDFLGAKIFPVFKITQTFEEAGEKYYTLDGKSGIQKAGLGEINLQMGTIKIDEHFLTLEKKSNMKTDIDGHDNGEISSMTVEDLEEIEGLLKLDVVKAFDLPYNQHLASFDCDPFVIVSFGTRTFRSKTILHNLNPVWNETVLIAIKKGELNFEIKFSVYDYDSFSKNDIIGTATIAFSDILKKKKGQDLPIKIVLDKPGNDLSRLILNFEFVPKEELKLHFWKKLAEIFDYDENGKLNPEETLGMLDLLHSSYDQKTITSIFEQIGEKEIPIEQISLLLEKVQLDPTEKLLSLETCPFTGKKLPDDNEKALIQLAINSFGDLSKVDQFVMGGFISEAYARKGFLGKLFTVVARGEYSLGADNGNILVQDRVTGEIVEEKMPSYIRIGIRALYQSKINKFGLNQTSVRAMLRNLSIKQGEKFNNKNSIKSIKPFIDFHNLSTEEMLDPIESFKNFNEFFYRKLKPEARKVAEPLNNDVLISPADSRLMAFPTIDNATELWIKGKNFTLSSLLQNETLAKKFEGGSLVIFRLAPQDYHRYHSPARGVLGEFNKIEGTLFTVNPMAVREQEVDVYTENKRVITTIQSEEFGTIGYVIIGAMMVGSIVLTAQPGQPLKKFDEIGYFGFGGSTIVCLFEPGKVNLDSDLVSNGKKQLETLIKVGESVGTKK